MNTGATSAAPSDSPTWVLVVGVIMIAVTILFAMYLVISDRKLTKDQRGLIAIIVALTTAMGFAFIGGYAKAEGKIPISESVSPISFGVGGGIAVFVIVYMLLSFTWVREKIKPISKDSVSMNLLPDMSLRSAIEEAAKANTADRSVEFTPESQKLDSYKVKEGRLSAQTTEKLIELIQGRIVGTESIHYTAEPKAGTNVIVVKISNP